MKKIRIFTGDSYLIDQKIDKIKSDFSKNNPSGIIENVDAQSTTTSEINELIRGTTLFWSSKLIVIKGVTQNKDLSESFEQIVGDLPDGVSVVVREDTLDKRSKLYKSAKSNKIFTIEEIIKPANINLWVKDTVNDQGGNIDQATASALIKKVGDNPAKLNYEVKKLIYFDKNITSKNVDNLIDDNLESSVFELVNAIFTQDKKRALQIYEKERKSGAEVPAIIGMIAWQIHLIATVAISKKQIADLAKDLKTNPYALSQTKNLSKNLNTNKIPALVNKISDLDYRVKTEQIDKDQAMKNLIVTI